MDSGKSIPLRKPRGRPRKVTRDPTALHYKCRHNKQFVNTLPPLDTPSIDSALTLSKKVYMLNQEASV
jgi:hypothetical protein